MVITKGIRIAGYTVIAAFILSFIALAVATGVQRHRINEYKEALTMQCAITDSLQNRCERLGSVDCITVNTTFVINNKTVLGVNTNAVNNLSRTYANWTKDEVLNAIDSLERIK